MAGNNQSKNKKELEQEIIEIRKKLWDPDITVDEKVELFHRIKEMRQDKDNRDLFIYYNENDEEQSDDLFKEAMEVFFDDPERIQNEKEYHDYVDNELSMFIGTEIGELKLEKEDERKTEQKSKRKNKNPLQRDIDAEINVNLMKLVDPRTTNEERKGILDELEKLKEQSNKKYIGQTNKDEKTINEIEDISKSMGDLFKQYEEERAKKAGNTSEIIAKMNDLVVKVSILTGCIETERNEEEKKAVKKQKGKKPEEKKPNDKKPDEKKPDEKKPDEKKPEEKKPDEKKPDEEKPEEKKSEEKKPDEKKPDEEKPEEKKSDRNKVDSIRAEIASILGIPVYDGIENEYEHAIQYQLDDWEIDRIQELRKKLQLIEKNNITRTNSDGKSRENPDDGSRENPDGESRENSDDDSNVENETEEKTKAKEPEYKIGGVKGVFLRFCRWVRSITKEGGFLNRFFKGFEEGLLASSKKVQKLKAGSEKKPEETKKPEEREKKPAEEAKKPKEKGKDQEEKTTEQKSEPIVEKSAEKQEKQRIEVEDAKWVRSKILENPEGDPKFTILRDITTAQRQKLAEDAYGNRKGLETIIAEEGISPKFENDENPKRDFANVLYTRTARHILDKAKAEKIETEVGATGERRPLEEIFNELAEKLILRENTDRVSRTTGRVAGKLPKKQPKIELPEEHDEP